VKPLEAPRNRVVGVRTIIADISWNVPTVYLRYREHPESAGSSLGERGVDGYADRDKGSTAGAKVQVATALDFMLNRN